MSPWVFVCAIEIEIHADRAAALTESRVGDAYFLLRLSSACCIGHPHHTAASRNGKYKKKKVVSQSPKLKSPPVIERVGGANILVRVSKDKFSHGSLGLSHWAKDEFTPQNW